MARYFFDSSALVKRYLLEEGTRTVLELIESGEPLVVSRLALVEIASTAARRVKSGDISGDQCDSLLQVLEEEFRTRFDVIELGGAAITRGVDLIRVHALRAADAIQLSCALMAAGGSRTGSEFVFVSSDGELNAAAEAEDLTVLDPCAP